MWGDEYVHLSAQEYADLHLALIAAEVDVVGPNGCDAVSTRALARADYLNREPVGSRSIKSFHDKAAVPAEY